MMQRVEGPELVVELETGREGVMSPVGHDLRFRLESAWVAWEAGGALEAEAAAASLTLLGALGPATPGVGRALDPRALSARDRAKITRSAAREVLESEAFPTLRLTLAPFDPAAGAAEGQLTLKGRAQPQPLRWHVEAGQVIVEAEIDQRRWGIRPFQAFFGALKVDPILRLRVSFPSPSAAEAPQ